MARPNNPAAIAAHVQGLREAKAAFQALPEIVRTRMNEAIHITASEIVRVAKAKILASPSVQTRSLYDSIAYTLSPTNGRAKAGVADVTTKISNSVMGGIGRSTMTVRGILIRGRNGSALKSQGARFIKPTRYAHLVEYGTRHSLSEPFMVPAKEQEKPHHIERCARAGRAIETDMAKVGGGLL